MESRHVLSSSVTSTNPISQSPYSFVERRAPTHARRLLNSRSGLILFDKVSSSTSGQLLLLRFNAHHGPQSIGNMQVPDTAGAAGCNAGIGLSPIKTAWHKVCS